MPADIHDLSPLAVENRNILRRTFDRLANQLPRNFDHPVLANAAAGIFQQFQGLVMKDFHPDIAQDFKSGPIDFFFIFPGEKR